MTSPMVKAGFVECFAPQFCWKNHTKITLSEVELEAPKMQAHYLSFIEKNKCLEGRFYWFS